MPPARLPAAQRSQLGAAALAVLAVPLLRLAKPALGSAATAEIPDACDVENDAKGGACSMALLQRAQGARRAGGDRATDGLAGRLQRRETGDVDMNGRPCDLCNPPLEGRTDRKYTMRTDCGNHSKGMEPEKQRKSRPLIEYSRPASEGKPATNAWCELNAQKVCADSLYNRDFLYQAKAVNYPKTLRYDPWYCHYNGWISQEIRDLSHDFEAMKRRSEEECRSEKYAHTGWNSTMTLYDFEKRYGPGLVRGKPTKEEALFIGAWTCAMGSSGCDMAYCSYSFCDKGNGTFGVYDDCKGWDPVRGMP